MSDSDDRSVVIDLGSSTVVSGFGGEHKPRSIIPSLVPDGSGAGVSPSARKPIIHRGEVQDWGLLEQLLTLVYNEEVRAKPEEHLLLISAPISKSERRKDTMNQILFETFQTPALCQVSEPLLSLYASGALTGTVVSLGGGLTQIVSVCEGFELPRSQHRLELAGGDVTHYLSRLLAAKGVVFVSSAEMEIVRALKEKMAYVSQDYNQQMALECTQWSPELDRYYQLPDGRNIQLDSELFTCTESLFQPAHLDRDMPGIHQAVYRSIVQCDVDLRRELSGSIHLVGGSALLPGLRERLVREVGNLLPPRVKVSLARSLTCNPQLAAWCGGSILSSLRGFAWGEEVVSKQDYDESGPNYIKRRPF